jgi:hypothetical protein
VYFERRRRRSVFIGSSPSPNTNPISVAIHLVLSIKVSNTTAKRHRNKRDDFNLSPSISVDIHFVQYTETSDTTVRRDRENHFCAFPTDIVSTNNLQEGVTVEKERALARRE